MEPASKKQKTSNNAKEKPVTFAWPGLVPDTCLQVFDREFHVHSIILKLHSAFFRKFLDSPEKNSAASNKQCGATESAGSSVVACSGPSMKYRWVAQVDKELGIGWCLVSEQSNIPDNGEAVSKDDQKCHIDNFNMLLCAIFGRPYVMGSVSQLAQLVGLADYYLALPAVSRSLDAALLASTEIGDSICERSTDALQLAVTCRNQLLFREALIHYTSNWNSSFLWHLQETRIESPKLVKLTRNVRNAMAHEILELQGVIDWETRLEHDFEVYEGKTRKDSVTLQDDFELLLPMYFRKLSIAPDGQLPSDEDSSCGQGPLRVALRRILRNNLRLSSKRIFEAGNADYVSYTDNDEGAEVEAEYCSERRFYFAEIDDEDLPWDRNEIDW